MKDAIDWVLPILGTMFGVRCTNAVFGATNVKSFFRLRSSDALLETLGEEIMNLKLGPIGFILSLSSDAHSSRPTNNVLAK